MRVHAHRNEGLLSPRRSQRGAVLLLSSFTTALVFLALTMALFIRSSTEMRAAERSRDALQAFYLAEGGLDSALVRYGLDPATVSWPSTSLQPGTYTYRMETVAVELIPPDIERTTYQIIATGTAAGSTEQVIGTFLDEQPGFTGLYTAGPIMLRGKMGAVNTPAMIRSGAGHIGSIVLTGAQTIGAVTVGSPRRLAEDFNALTNYGNYIRPTGTMLSISPPWSPEPYKTLSYVQGIDGYNQKAAIYQDPSYGQFYYDLWGGASSLGSTAAVPLTIQPWIDKEKSRPVRGGGQDSQPLKLRCGEGLVLGESEALVVSDGHPLDLSKPDDGKIVVCQEAIVLNKGAQLQFEEPATVYLTGPAVSLSLPGQYSWDRYTGSGLYGQSVASGISGLGGVRLVVPEWAAKPGALVFYGGTFSGSIWAPQSNVGVYSQDPKRTVVDSPDCQYLGTCVNSDHLDPSRIVANFLYINNECSGCPGQFTFPSSEDFSGSSTPQSTGPSKAPPLVSWTN